MLEDDLINDAINNGKPGLEYVMTNYTLSDDYIINNADRIDWYSLHQNHGISKDIQERFWDEILFEFDFRYFHDIDSDTLTSPEKMLKHKDFADHIKSCARESGLEISKFNNLWSSQCIIDLDISRISLSSMFRNKLLVSVIDNKSHRDVANFTLDYSEKNIERVIKLLPSIKEEMSKLTNASRQSSAIAAKGCFTKYSEVELLVAKDIEEKQYKILSEYFDNLNG